MTPTRPASSSRRTSLIASFALAAAVLTPLLSTPLSASASIVGLIFCPPAVVKVGTPVKTEIADYHDSAGLTTSINAGTLPDGLILPPDTGRGHIISGTPTKLGLFTFTVQFLDRGRADGSKTCSMDIVPADSKVERLSGDNRYFTSTEIGRKVAPTTAPLVYVASGENYPDALSATAIAAQHNAPLVLSPHDETPNYVINQIDSWHASNVVVVGGENALNDYVVGQLERLPDHPTVTRIDGADRYEVSRNLISHPTFGAKASTSIMVATGQRFPDALSATPPAGMSSTPVLLVNGSAPALSAAESALLASRGVTNATVFGGDDTVSAGIAAGLETVAGTVNRIEGHDRFATSAMISATYFPSHVDTLYVATGENFPDALSGGVLAALNHSPILLTHKSCVAPEVAAQVRALTPNHIVLLGGPDVLDAKLENLPLCS